MRYTPTDCFETFPFPPCLDTASAHAQTAHQAALRERLEQLGAAYHSHRQALMRSRQEGLTKSYNRFHDRDEQSSDIAELRRLHVAMDNAVAAAYGWDALNLDHGFHQTKQGLRFTVSEAARREILDRLLALNHQRHAEEVAAGLHDQASRSRKGSKGPAQTKESVGVQGELF